MTETEEIDKEWNKKFLAVEKQTFLDHVVNAFGLSSGGIGVYLHAVENFARGYTLKDFEETSLHISGSNFFYFFDNSRLTELPSGILSPLIHRHLALKEKTLLEYDQLRRLEIILIFTGKEPSVENFRTKWLSLTAEEIVPLLKTARSLDLLDFSDKSLMVDKIERTTSIGELMLDLIHAGVKLNDSFFERLLGVGDVNFFRKYQEHFLKPALYKLGEMLAGVEEFTAEANTWGIPLSPDHRPDNKKWLENWQKMFDEPMPTIKELYEQAFAVFSRYADRNDPFLAYLFTKEAKPKWQS